MKKIGPVRIGLIAVLAGAACTMAIAAAITMLVIRETIPITVGKMMMLVAVCISALVISVLVMNRIGKRRILFAMCAVAVYVMVCLFAAGLITPVDEVKVGWKIAFPFATVLLTGVLFASKFGRKR